jgi:hypothetical protein
MPLHSDADIDAVIDGLGKPDAAEGGITTGAMTPMNDRGEVWIRESSSRVLNLRIAVLIPT